MDKKERESVRNPLEANRNMLILLNNRDAIWLPKPLFTIDKCA